MERLSRVADPAALASCEGARARLAVDVPAAWLEEGADLAITAPSRLPCARCDGGGCDGCARSGALRAPEDAALRVVRTRVPPNIGSAVALRIPQPFGPDHEIAQLVVELHAAPRASDHVRRIAEAPAPAASLPVSPYAVAAVLAAVAAIVAALVGR